MIYLVNLPRSGGQSIGTALVTLTGKSFMHSLDNWDKQVLPADGGVIEVWAPIPWLRRRDPDATIILPIRQTDEWLHSCSRVYEKAQGERWNNPIWRYDLSMFSDYRDEYHRARFSGIDFTIQVPEELGWSILCQNLNLPIPSIPFPDYDYPGGRADKLVREDNDLNFGLLY